MHWIFSFIQFVFSLSGWSNDIKKSTQSLRLSCDSILPNCSNAPVVNKNEIAKSD